VDYLRVKNWSRFQHYAKRRSPWINLYNDLIGDGDDFEHLGELEQWQLVRIWMQASKSSRFTLDGDGKIVPVLPNDEQTIRRSIQTLKKVPLASFVRDGWLIVVAEAALIDPDARAVLAPVLANGHENGATSEPNASALLEPENQRFREEEDQDQCTDLFNSAKIREQLGTDRYHALEKILKLVKGGDEGTPGVLAALCKKLPASEIDDVRMAYAAKRSVPVGKAVNALKQRAVEYETAMKLAPTPQEAHA